MIFIFSDNLKIVYYAKGGPPDRHPFELIKATESDCQREQLSTLPDVSSNLYF